MITTQLRCFYVVNSQVSIKESASLQQDSNVCLNIPVHTVIAYGIIDLKVKRNGHYELCLIDNNLGGFEVDGPCKMDLPGVFGSSGDALESSCLQRELEILRDQFQLLSVLPSETRSSLLQLLRNMMKNREEVSALESVLDRMCRGKATKLDETSKTVQAVVDLMEQSDDQGQNHTRTPSLLSATHLISGALDEMTSEGLMVLVSCCSPSFLEALQILVQCVAAGSEETISLTDTRLTVLTEEEEYGRAECLFDNSNVILKREEDTLRTEMKDQPGHHPLVLSIAVMGLASLGTTVSST
ncbi:hypothetical protein DPEC_G00140160 [Dallia pectoralis]|uniref:Uncharacterized protein n=1 Tax=Dallia pectoralis TaxID=75939 RepID=A0ACC2GMD7_DALPE|nr:hypothetical protein DPEC_G00140160 [Dallia pectoralis]